MTCDDARRMIARRADESGDVGSDAALDAHVSSCAGCHAALQEQREVVAVLRSRPLVPVSATFSQRLAARLDEASGWFGIADWRIWTFRVAPIAAALALVALLTSSATQTQTSPSSTHASSTVTIDEWARSGLDASRVSSMLWQKEVTTESLLESMVTGHRPSIIGESNGVR
jgi:hypothetical protein